MIERMKKITILAPEKERAELVSELQKEGVLHLSEMKVSSHHEIGFIEARIKRVDSLIAILEPYDGATPEDERKTMREREIFDCVDLVEDAHVTRGEVELAIREKEKVRGWFRAWGLFDPAELEIFKKHGVQVKFYRMAKDDFNKLAKDKNKYYFVKKEKDDVYIAVITFEGEEISFVDRTGGKINCETMTPPEESPERLAVDIAVLCQQVMEIDDFMQEKALALESIKECKRKLEEEHIRLKVRFGMQEEGKFSYLVGFCPAKKAEQIRAMAERHKYGYVSQDPDDPEETPTLMANPIWIRIIDPVFQFMNILPGYKEMDISFPFLVFFGLFFAMLIADAGYGIFFLLVTFLAHLKFKNIPKEPVILMYILSVATIAWGALTGSWFGSEAIASLPFLEVLRIKGISGASEAAKNGLINLCFMIGAIQLTVAHGLRALKAINSVKAIAELGWIMIVWGMFFLAGNLVIYTAFPPFALWLLVLGAVLALIFTNASKGILKGLGETVIELPLHIISSFGDVVSYIRLFAVGYAGAAVAESFNEMLLGGGVHSVIRGLMVAVLLFAAHLVNIMLGLMAVIVHGIRLNMLEFSSHLGMRWIGKKYEPFCERSR